MDIHLGYTQCDCGRKMCKTLLQYEFFFFQAEDGIRDDLVTGVQTCALPIYLPLPSKNSINISASISVAEQV